SVPPKTMSPRAPQSPEPSSPFPGASKIPPTPDPCATAAGPRFPSCHLLHDPGIAPVCPRTRTPLRGSPPASRPFPRTPRPGIRLLGLRQPESTPPARPSSDSGAPRAPTPRAALLDNLLGAHRRSCTLLPSPHFFQSQFSLPPSVTDYLSNLSFRVYFIPSYTARASRNLFITKSFSAAEFQSGYFSVTSMVRSIQALKYSASSREYARFPPIVTYTGLVVAYA